MKGIVWICILVIMVAACKPAQLITAEEHQYVKSFDTSDKSIEHQVKKTYQIGNVYLDNQFDAARLNAVTPLNDTTLVIYIQPENTPINPSPWYAFRMWAQPAKQVTLILDYGKYHHRYNPQVSEDGMSWNVLNDSIKYLTVDSSRVQFSVSVPPDTIWISAQELVSSSQVKSWCKTISHHPHVNFQLMGKSKEGRDLPMLDIYEESPKEKEMIVILSRQHPPEVTGYFAMQEFITTIMADISLSNAFRKQFRLLVFPVMNPDGVDLGHWRHSAAGVDLNRDWAVYHQPETRQVADYIVQTSSLHKNRVILGLDFHSTYHDVYYTNSDTESVLPGFKVAWFSEMEKMMAGLTINEKPSLVERPVSKSWFYTQFKAEGITYEIGDETARDFIKLKGRISAEAMMKVLLEMER